jgi:hypothetical protein
MPLMKSTLEIMQRKEQTRENSTYPYLAKFAQHFIIDLLKISSALV